MMPAEASPRQRRPAPVNRIEPANRILAARALSPPGSVPPSLPISAASSRAPSLPTSRRPSLLPQSPPSIPPSIPSSLPPSIPPSCAPSEPQSPRGFSVDQQTNPSLPPTAPPSERPSPRARSGAVANVPPSSTIPPALPSSLPPSLPGSLPPSAPPSLPASAAPSQQVSPRRTHTLPQPPSVPPSLPASAATSVQGSPRRVVAEPTQSQPVHSTSRSNGRSRATVTASPLSSNGSSGTVTPTDGTTYAHGRKNPSMAGSSAGRSPARAGLYRNMAMAASSPPANASPPSQRDVVDASMEHVIQQHQYQQQPHQSHSSPPPRSNSRSPGRTAIFRDQAMTELAHIPSSSPTAVRSVTVETPKLVSVVEQKESSPHVSITSAVAVTHPPTADNVPSHSSKKLAPNRSRVVGAPIGAHSPSSKGRSTKSMSHTIPTPITSASFSTPPHTHMSTHHGQQKQHTPTAHNQVSHYQQQHRQSSAHHKVPLDLTSLIAPSSLSSTLPLTQSSANRPVRHTPHRKEPLTVEINLTTAAMESYQLAQSAVLGDAKAQGKDRPRSNERLREVSHDPQRDRLPGHARESSFPLDSSSELSTSRTQYPPLQPFIMTPLTPRSQQAGQRLYQDQYLDPNIPFAQIQQPTEYWDTHTEQTLAPFHSPSRSNGPSDHFVFSQPTMISSPGSPSNSLGSTHQLNSTLVAPTSPLVHSQSQPIPPVPVTYHAAVAELLHLLQERDSTDGTALLSRTPSWYRPGWVQHAAGLSQPSAPAIDPNEAAWMQLSQFYHELQCAFVDRSVRAKVEGNLSPQKSSGVVTNINDRLTSVLGPDHEAALERERLGDARRAQEREQARKAELDAIRTVRRANLDSIVQKFQTAGSSSSTSTVNGTDTSIAANTPSAAAASNPTKILRPAPQGDEYGKQAVPSNESVPPQLPPSNATSTAPSLPPSEPGSTVPSLPPSVAPSTAVSRRPSIPDMDPSLPPSEPPSQVPSRRPSLPDSAPTENQPSLPPSLPASVAGSRRPSLPDSAPLEDAQADRLAQEAETVRAATLAKVAMEEEEKAVAEAERERQAQIDTAAAAEEAERMEQARQAAARQDAIDAEIAEQARKEAEKQAAIEAEKVRQESLAAAGVQRAKEAAQRKLAAEAKWNAARRQSDLSSQEKVAASAEERRKETERLKSLAVATSDKTRREEEQEAANAKAKEEEIRRQAEKVAEEQLRQETAQRLEAEAAERKAKNDALKAVEALASKPNAEEEPNQIESIKVATEEKQGQQSTENHHPANAAQNPAAEPTIPKDDKPVATNSPPQPTFMLKDPVNGELVPTQGSSLLSLTTLIPSPPHETYAAVSEKEGFRTPPRRSSEVPLAHQLPSILGYASPPDSARRLANANEIDQEVESFMLSLSAPTVPLEPIVETSRSRAPLTPLEFDERGRASEHLFSEDHSAHVLPPSDQPDSPDEESSEDDDAPLTLALPETVKPSKPLGIVPSLHLAGLTEKQQAPTPSASGAPTATALAAPFSPQPSEPTSPSLLNRMVDSFSQLFTPDPAGSEHVRALEERARIEQQHQSRTSTPRAQPKKMEQPKSAVAPMPPAATTQRDNLNVEPAMSPVASPLGLSPISSDSPEIIQESPEMSQPTDVTSEANVESVAESVPSPTPSAVSAPIPIGQDGPAAIAPSVFSQSGSIPSESEYRSMLAASSDGKLIAPPSEPEPVTKEQEEVRGLWSQMEREEDRPLETLHEEEKHGEDDSIAPIEHLQEELEDDTSDSSDSELYTVAENDEEEEEPAENENSSNQVITRSASPFSPSPLSPEHEQFVPIMHGEEGIFIIGDEEEQVDQTTAGDVKPTIEPASEASPQVALPQSTQSIALPTEPAALAVPEDAAALTFSAAPASPSVESPVSADSDVPFLTPVKPTTTTSESTSSVDRPGLGRTPSLSVHEIQTLLREEEIAALPRTLSLKEIQDQLHEADVAALPPPVSPKSLSVRQIQQQLRDAEVAELESAANSATNTPAQRKIGDEKAFSFALAAASSSAPTGKHTSPKSLTANEIQDMLRAEELAALPPPNFPSGSSASAIGPSIISDPSASSSSSSTRPTTKRSMSVQEIQQLLRDEEIQELATQPQTPIGGKSVSNGTSTTTVGSSSIAPPPMTPSAQTNRVPASPTSASSPPSLVRDSSVRAPRSSILGRFDPSSAAHSKRLATLAAFSALREKQSILLKHGRRGRAHPSQIKIHDGSLYWNWEEWKKDAPSSKCIPLLTVSAVLGGRRTGDLRRSANEKDEDLCFAVICPSRDLSLQVQGTKEDRDLWVSGLTIAIETLRQEQSFWDGDKALAK